MDFYRTQELLKLRIPKSFSQAPQYFFWRQVNAIIKKRLLTFHRDWKMWILLFFSVVLMLISIAAFQSLYPHDNSTNNRVIHEIIFSTVYSVWVVIALALCTGIFIETPVLERENKLRYAFKVTGLRDTPYWIGTFLADFLLYLMPGLCFVALIFLFNVTTLTAYIGSTIPIYLLFGGPLITFMYLCSYLFKSAQTAFKSIGFIMYLLGFIVPVGLTTVLKIYSSCAVVKTVDAILSVIPILQLYDAQMDMLTDYISSKFDNIDTDILLCKGVFPKAWHIIIFFIVQTALYLFFTILIDKAKNKLYSRSNRQAANANFLPEDQDFINGEATRIRADSLRPDNDVVKEA